MNVKIKNPWYLARTGAHQVMGSWQGEYWVDLETLPLSSTILYLPAEKAHCWFFLVKACWNLARKLRQHIYSFPISFAQECKRLRAERCRQRTWQVHHVLHPLVRRPRTRDLCYLRFHLDACEEKLQVHYTYYDPRVIVNGLNQLVLVVHLVWSPGEGSHHCCWWPTFVNRRR